MTVLDRCPSSAESVSAWEQVLHAYAAVIDDHRSMLTTMRADGMTVDELVLPPRFVPPAGIGLLPKALVPRAQALAAETSGLVELASQISAELAVAVAGPSPVRTAQAQRGDFTMDHRM